jgi:hypothetical protein
MNFFFVDLDDLVSGLNRKRDIDFTIAGVGLLAASFPYFFDGAVLMIVEQNFLAGL